MREVKLRVRPEDGWVMLPSSLKLATTAPRFHLAFPMNDEDPGLRLLVLDELGAGYDVVTRDFIEGTLRAGDLFVDVGAHWGLFTLQAATHPVGDICVVAFEPDPWNATVLFKNVFSNERFDRVRVVCAACGDAAGLGPLVSNGSMAHSLEGTSLTETAVRLPPKWVAIVALDRALAAFPESASRRIILKVDAEGYDAQVLLGARALLESGRTGAVIWETGWWFRKPGPRREAMLRVLDLLGGRGFRCVLGSKDPIPFDLDMDYTGNVFAIPSRD